MPTVLIAEDDRILTRVLEKKFAGQADRFEAVFAEDGQAAIDVLRQRTVSMLVTDLQMPRIDGFRLLAHMNEHHPVVPCLVMSARRPDPAAADATEDAIHYFSKPVNPDVLIQAICQVLERDIPKGALHGISVVSFLQMIAMEKKTCLFDITFHDGDTGRLYFKQGVLFDAVYGGLRREAAALALISTREARFRFRFVPRKTPPRRIAADLMPLIMEAKRREMGLPPMKVAS